MKNNTIILFILILVMSNNIPCFTEGNEIFITIESNTKIIKNDDNITLIVFIKNVSDKDYELDLDYFMFASFYLKFSYYNNVNEKINVPVSNFGHVSRSFNTVSKILKPNETYSRTIIGTYRANPKTRLVSGLA
jgi:hypothetical protein